MPKTKTPKPLSEISSAQFIAIWSAGFVLFSASFNFGFFLVVGLKFLPLLALSDHISIGIAIFPIALGLILLWVFVIFLINKKRDGVKPNSRKVRYLFRALLTLLIVRAALDYSYPWPFLMLVAAIIWVGACEHYRHDLVKFFNSKISTVAFTVLPYVSLLIMAAGMARAFGLVTQEEDFGYVQLQEEVLLEVPILLNISRGTLVYLDNRFVFFDSSSIRSVAGPEKELEMSRFSKFFNVEVPKFLRERFLDAEDAEKPEEETPEP